MSKTVLFIGSNPNKPPHTGPAIEAGYNLVLVKSKPGEKDYRLFDHIIKADEYNLKEVLTKVKGFNKKQKIDGCLTRFEHFVPTAAAITEELGLTGPSLKSALATRNKLLMREIFLRNNIPSPKFVKVSSFEDLKRAVDYLKYPFLLKPISGAKSRFILFIDDRKDLEKAFSLINKGIKTSSHGLFRPIKGTTEEIDFTKDFVAENVMRGTQHTTITLVFKGKAYHIALADLVTAQDKGIDAFYIISRTTPSLLSEKEQEKIKEISTAGIKALEIDNSPVHPELILTKSGPKVLEIAARIGGYRTEMTALAFGVKLNKAAIDICLGIKPNLKKKFEKASTAVEVWPRESGRIKGFKNLEKVKKMKGVIGFKLKKNVGERFDLPPFGEKPVATFLTVADSPENSKRIAEEVLEKFKVIF